jgi:Ca2+-binding RTX toxin-like protein
MTFKRGGKRNAEGIDDPGDGGDVSGGFGGCGFRDHQVRRPRPRKLQGTSYGDSLYGYGGDDRLAGGSGEDLLEGKSGNDDPGFDAGPMVRGLYGGSGGDLLSGGSGNDSIGGPGPGAYDEIYCGQGRDFVEARAIDCETVERY